MVWIYFNGLRTIKSKRIKDYFIAHRHAILMITTLLVSMVYLSIVNYLDSTSLWSTLNSIGKDKYFALIDGPEHANCVDFLAKSPRANPNSVDESDDISLAYSIVIHKDVHQFARLLRMIYTPYNFYCVHTDRRTNHRLNNALNGLLRCFGSNVYLVPREERVPLIWGEESVLLPQLICARKALQKHSTWSYLINLTGQEFPLRTNRELIAIGKALNNSILVECLNPGELIYRTNQIMLAHNATWFKGSLYGMFPRGFLNFILNDEEKARPILEVMIKPRAVQHPDEFLFPTFAYNPHLGAPCSCTVPQSESEKKDNYLGRFVIWTQNFPFTCETKTVRGVCILGNPHVSRLQQAPHLFANKFHAFYHQEAYDQMEEWFFNKLAIETIYGKYNLRQFNVNIYAERTCSRNHI